MYLEYFHFVEVDLVVPSSREDKYLQYYHPVEVALVGHLSSGKISSVTTCTTGSFGNVLDTLPSEKCL